MNKKLLSIVIANAVAAPGLTYANEDTDYYEKLRKAQDSVLYEDLFNARGTIGTAFEFEENKTKRSNGTQSKEKIHTPTLINASIHHGVTALNFGYELKKEHKQKREFDQSGTQLGFENQDGYINMLSVDRGFSLGNGFATGLYYGVEIGKSKINGTWGTNIDVSKVEHIIKPSLTYWNPKYSMGFYSHIEIGFTEEDKSEWGIIEEDAYSLLVKPYYRTGNWELGMEMFYQIKDIEESSGNKSEFDEIYVEPIVTYSFEDAGVLYVRARVGQNETRNTAGWGVGDEYYTDILKGTVGYEQAVGDDWLLKAEYEYTRDDKTNNTGGPTEEVIGNKFYLQALYRF
ncbi:porin [Vibrio sp. WXL103]|uniref:porin n=1 Tax=Vibrio sp. WXL103 TaxID=3450710 RepID=UPI003EC7BBAB